MNKNGLSLIELLVCVVIIGIIAPFIGHFIVQTSSLVIKANQSIVQLGKKIDEANKTAIICSCLKPGNGLGDDNHIHIANQ